MTAIVSIEGAREAVMLLTAAQQADTVAGAIRLHALIHETSCHATSALVLVLSNLLSDEDVQEMGLEIAQAEAAGYGRVEI